MREREKGRRLKGLQYRTPDEVYWDTFSKE
jgi:hypothetical protein